MRMTLLTPISGILFTPLLLWSCWALPALEASWNDILSEEGWRGWNFGLKFPCGAAGR